MSEALVAAAVREVYGDAPTAEQMTAVLAVVDNYYRAQRGTSPSAFTGPLRFRPGWRTCGIGRTLVRP
jgi:hypothetical protein